MRRKDRRRHPCIPLNKDPRIFFQFKYTTKGYSRQYEKYIMEYLQVEIHYTIDGENYISTFGTFQSNVDDGTDFFENERLKTPVEPEE